MSNTEIVACCRVRTIFDAVEARIPSRLALAHKLIDEHADTPLQTVTVANIMGGMRGLSCMLWEISGTENATILYHGKPMDELLSVLPKWPGSAQPSPEAMLWYLYTASVPSRAELIQFSRELIRRATMPLEVERVCDAMPSDLPPEAQLPMGLCAYARRSKFIAALHRGAPKADLWRHALEDALDGASAVPMVVARIYNNKYGGGAARSIPLDASGDLAKNFAIRMGRGDDLEFAELIRLYWSVHVDHGVNVTAHNMRLSSSAWTNPYFTMAAGMLSGTGTLHGGAIERSVRYILDMADVLGPYPSSHAISAHVQATLSRGQIVPGYGHALLRKADPRFAPIMQFVNDSSLLREDGRGGRGKELMSLIVRASILIPAVLRKWAPKIKSPEANVDSLSGSVVNAFGVEEDFVMLIPFCSRAMGCMAQYVWDKALGIPLERPLSVTMDQIMAKL